ncbi:hypothetical protein [Catenuloplanes indicus]|uniref:DUF4386 family protein n=1 Tax=Catenuloplanes indicus TaxID=137267 RepID=A0AAE3VV17_9ACTN|nr:hypothetical protein [Catenuloplanes indicus]MDQ0364256.1 hypothetical protein [Catenuloplanes indicus]
MRTRILLIAAPLAMVASAALVVPSGLTLNPSAPAATLAAVHDRTALHLLELALDLLGWLALTTAGLTLAASAAVRLADSPPTGGLTRAASAAVRPAEPSPTGVSPPDTPVCRGGASGTPTESGLPAAVYAGQWVAESPSRGRAAGDAAVRAVVAGGLLAAAGVAGVLHDAGNLAVTQLAGRAGEPGVIGAATAVMLVAKWGVNLAGLLWTAATLVAAGGRWTGLVVGAFGLAAVVLPWTAGAAGASPALEQVGYLLHVPVMAWWALRPAAGAGGRMAG